jgi:hypothetical protein
MLWIFYLQSEFFACASVSILRKKHVRNSPVRVIFPEDFLLDLPDARRAGLEHGRGFLTMPCKYLPEQQSIIEENST